MSKNKNLFTLLSELTSKIPESQKEALIASEKLRLNISIAMIKLRKSLGVTQKELAERLGVSQSWVSKLENANNDHQIESIQRYLKALGAELTLVIEHRRGTQSLVMRVSDGELSIENRVSSPRSYEIKPIFASNLKGRRYPIGAA